MNWIQNNINDNDLNIVNGQTSMEQAVIMRLKTEIEDCALCFKLSALYRM